MTKRDTDRQEVDRSMDAVDGLIHTDRRTDRQSERVNSNSDRLVRRCGWVEEEEERMRKAKGRRRKGKKKKKKFKCLGFHTVNLAVQSPVAPFSHSSSLLSETC